MNSSYANSSSESNPFSPSASSEHSLLWIIHLCVSVLIFVVSAVGNIIMLLIVHGGRRIPPSHSSHGHARGTPYELFIANLCYTDLAFVFCYLIAKYAGIPRSLLFCALFQPLINSTMVASIMTLTAMAMFRRRLVMHPYRPKPTRRTVQLSIAGLWGISILCMAPLMAVSRVSPDGMECVEHWPKYVLNKVYTVALVVIQYAVPLTVIIVSYSQIVRYLRQHRPPGSRNHGHEVAEREVIRAFTAIAVLYTVLNLPGQIAWLQLVFGSLDSAEIWFTFSDLCLVAHSCANPFVYGTVTRRFRSGFVYYLSRIFCWGKLAQLRRGHRDSIHGNVGCVLVNESGIALENVSCSLVPEPKESTQEKSIEVNLSDSL